MAELETGVPRQRVDGYAALREYAAIGDGHTLALVASDGSIDWLCAPAFDGASVFGRLLDAELGGSASIRPAAQATSERRYLPDTNVLETIFRTSDGVLRVTDAMAIALDPDAPFRTILRRAECLSGPLAIEWDVLPRFDYGQQRPDVSPSGDGAWMTGGGLVLRAHTHGLGGSSIDEQGLHGRCVLEPGDRGLLAIVVGEGMPHEATRDGLEAELDRAAAWWRDWVARSIRYEGPWRPAVVRSGLALKLLVSAQTGAIVAAGTTSLPEVPGGERNWDYRFSWVRDALLVLDAFFALGCSEEATAYFGWLRERLDRTEGQIGVLYGLRGEECMLERELPLHGWNGARPVRVGNDAAGQFQSSTYGTLLHACHLYANEAHGGLPLDQRHAILRSASLLADVWAQPDAGIWEERGPLQHHTNSKMLAVLGLHCASDLAKDASQVLAARLAAESARAAAYVEDSCVDPATGAYARTAGATSYDASVLLPLGMGYARFSSAERVSRTIDVIRERLGQGGSLLHRYLEDDGMSGQEAFFTPCSFWLARALADNGRVNEAADAMDELVGLANDVGLYSEEIGTDGAFLGNLPQAISHASLVSAANAVDDAIT
ncbi:MAG TPA: glycoside hydrolase family 15 protein [Gaiellales bacterium]